MAQCPGCSWQDSGAAHTHDDAEDGPRAACCAHTCVTAPDRTITLAETSGLLRRVADAMIAERGFYTFSDASTGQKVMVVR